MAATGALSACAGAATPEPITEIVEKEVVVTATTAPRTGPAVVTIYRNMSAEHMSRFNDYVASFLEANPDVMVQPIPAIGGNIENRQKLQAMILAGTPPDIAGYCPPDFIWSGMVQSLQPFIERDSYDLSEFSAPLLSAVTYENELYVLPKGTGGNNVIMVYNKTMWEEAGVEPPPTKWNDPDWTWDEWVLRLKALTLDKDGDGRTDQYGMGSLGWFMSHTRQWDTWWINVDDMSTITADSREILDCYQHYGDLFCQHAVVPSVEVTEGWGPVDPFLAGMVSMAVVGSWVFTTYDKSEIDWDFAPFPKALNTNAEFDYYGSSAIVKGAKNASEAWEFMKWETDANAFRFFGSPPPKMKWIDEWGQTTFPQHPDINYALMGEAIENAREQDRITLHPCWSEMWGKVINPRREQLELCNLSAEQMLAECQTELQAIADACQTKAF